MFKLHSHLAFILVILLLPLAADAQRRGRGVEEDAWPPERGYGRTTLGSALQSTFARHYDACGFGKAEGGRDYTPPSLETFLGNRNLRTRVEQADVNGGNLLNYIFTGDEIRAPFDDIQFRPDRLLYNATDGIDLAPEPRPGFDAFLLTKNCGGYLKASLDAGFKVPYVSLTAALDSDDRRNSSVVAMAGSFISPLTEVLEANDVRTTELMARLWQFYARYPHYISGAFYLAGYDGIMVSHLTEAESIRRFERGVGANITLPLAGHLGGNLTLSKENRENFSGTDWQTIVFTDFSGPYQRETLYARLPSPREIQHYFATRPLASTSAGSIAALREGGNHTVHFQVEGVPSDLLGMDWRMENIRGGAYRGKPSFSLQPSPSKNGMRVQIAGASSDDLFAGADPTAIQSLPIGFELVLPPTAALPELRIPLATRLPVSHQPVLSSLPSRFELQRENNGEFAFRWHLTFSVRDDENGIDASQLLRVTELRVGNETEPMAVRAVSSRYDRRKETVEVVLQTYGSWPLQRIDDRRMRTIPARIEMELPVVDGAYMVKRTLSTAVALPDIVANDAD